MKPNVLLTEFNALPQLSFESANLDEGKSDYLEVLMLQEWTVVGWKYIDYDTDDKESFEVYTFGNDFLAAVQKFQELIQGRRALM